MSVNSIEIPMIDITNFDRSENDKLILSKKIKSAVSHVGFFYLTGHGIKSKTLNDLLVSSRIFFKQELKDKIGEGSLDANQYCGYLPYYKEHVNNLYDSDFHESFDISVGRKVANRSTYTLFTDIIWPNDTYFKDSFISYYEKITNLSEKLFCLFALALGFEDEDFRRYLKNPMHTVRVNHYPPQKYSKNANSRGINEHSDYECFTILYQDEVPGLEVCLNESKWKQIEPLEDTFIINIGDLLEFISNGTLKSTKHRVINNTNQDRLSIASFHGFDYDTTLSELSNSVSNKKLTAGEYLNEKLKVTFV